MSRTISKQHTKSWLANIRARVEEEKTWLRGEGKQADNPYLPGVKSADLYFLLSLVESTPSLAELFQGAEQPPVDSSSESDGESQSQAESSDE